MVMVEGETIRMVVVEDDADWQRLASIVLGGHPAFDLVEVVGDPDEAVCTAERVQPDVLLLDLHLSGRSGMALVPALRDRAPATTIVTWSIEWPDEPRTRPPARGTVGHIAKTGEVLALPGELLRLTGR